MNKQDLVDQMAARMDIPKALAKEFLDTFTEVVAGEVACGGKVTLYQLGSFERVHRKARVAHNPATGQPVQVPASHAVKFRPAQHFRERVNGRHG